MPTEPNRAPQADEHADGLPNEPRHQQQTGGQVPQSPSGSDPARPDDRKDGTREEPR